MPALRPTVKKKKRVWLRVVLLVVAIAAIFDWMRPPDRQATVAIYRTVVLKGYYLLLQPWGKHFIHCRFRPTCSVYSRHAMETHGFPKGLWLTTARLFRCMPWVPDGTADPVPPAEGKRD